MAPDCFQNSPINSLISVRKMKTYWMDPWDSDFSVRLIVINQRASFFWPSLERWLNNGRTVRLCNSHRKQTCRCIRRVWMFTFSRRKEIACCGWERNNWARVSNMWEFNIFLLLPEPFGGFVNWKVPRLSKCMLHEDLLGNSSIFCDARVCKRKKYHVHVLARKP